MVQNKELVLAMVGLGYVGLPLAIEFAKAGVDTIGFDIKEKRIEELRQNTDSSNETSSDELAKAPIKESSMLNGWDSLRKNKKLILRYTKNSLNHYEQK